MKHMLLTWLLALSFLTATAQDISVEKSTYGIQVGFFGVYGHNESRLSNTIALRSELGLDAAIYSNNFAGSRKFVLVPALTLAPRWYYNLKKRVSKSRRIDGNSGNFIAIKTSYHPDIVIGHLDDNVNFISDISIIPTWGIRRHIGQHFTYETGIGMGFIHFFEEDNVYLSSTSGLALNLHLRIGYRF